MISRADGSPDTDAPTAPLLVAFFELLSARPERFERDPKRAGLDVRCAEELNGRRNRARLKAFLPQPQTFVLFIYKDSQTPGSDDRFAYGAYVAKNAPPDPSALVACLDYAFSGLHPERRPRDLKRAFPYDVPN